MQDILNFILFKDDDEETTEFARILLHGKGYDRWFDKSFNLIFSKNARVS